MDIVGRLRTLPGPGQTMTEAADEIERLQEKVEAYEGWLKAKAVMLKDARTENARLRAALAPFANPPLYVFDDPNGKWVPDKMTDNWIGGGWFSTQEFAEARRALKDTTP